MPYNPKRSYRRRRKTSRRTRPISSGNGNWGGWPRATAQIAKTAAKGMLKYYLNPERKAFDVTANAISITSGTGVITTLTQVPQGDGAADRDGITVRAQSIDLRVSVEQNPATALGVNNIVRVILFIDTQKNTGASTASSQILQDNTNIRSPLNMANRGRYTILADRWVALVADSSNTIKIVKIYRKVFHHVKWDDTNANADTNLRAGHMYLLMLTDATANQPLYSVWSRFRFLDN